VLKQFAMAVTAAMVLASAGAVAAGAETDQRVDRLHQHQGIGPGGITPPSTHHHHHRRPSA
jgi:hypothetical protein